MKNLLVALTAVFITSITFSQQKEYQLSTHILDILKGIPASNATIKLEEMEQKSQTWKFIS